MLMHLPQTFALQSQQIQHQIQTNHKVRLIKTPPPENAVVAVSQQTVVLAVQATKAGHHPKRKQMVTA